MPPGIDLESVMETGKNPGLGVRGLHAQGTDGRGISIAIIDQELLTTHQEYADRLARYEQQDLSSRQEAYMHGAAVASIAVGKTVGVAPKANLFYIAGVFRMEGERFDARPITQALQRIIQMNKRLPMQEKIRVVSISRGFSEQDIGAADFDAVRQQLEQSAVAVITTDSPLFTLSRAHALAPADDMASYTRPAYWFKEREIPFYEELHDVLVPSDYRTTASPTGDTDYVFYTHGGLSWAVPYVAGLYALGAQVYPDLTPELFWQTLRQTAAEARVQGTEGKTYNAHSLVQPVKFIEKLQNLAQ